MNALTVIEAFLGHAKGDIITDTEAMQKYIGSEWEGHFIKCTVTEFVWPPEPVSE